MSHELSRNISTFGKRTKESHMKQLVVAGAVVVATGVVAGAQALKVDAALTAYQSGRAASRGA